MSPINTVAGIRSVIKCYQLGGDVKRDKTLEKVIEEDKNGTLEDFIKKKLAEK